MARDFRLSVDAMRLVGLIATYLRMPADATIDDADVLVATFAPPLSVAEEATLADIRLMAKFGVDMTLAEWQSIKADAAGLKAYLGVATPTLVQTAAATKAIIRVLAVIVRS